MQVPFAAALRRVAKQQPALLLEAAFYGAFALVPLLWFHPHGLITGGDIDFPLHPVQRLWERSFVWSHLFLGGSDRSLDTTTLFYVLVQVLPYLATHSLIIADKVSLCFWFVLPGLAMSYLLNGMFPGRRLLRMVGAAAYMLNPYQLYNFEIARIGEISATSCLPLVMGAYARAFDRRLQLLPFAATMAVVGIVTMGIGVQPPSILACLVVFAAFLIVELYAVLRRDGLDGGRRWTIYVLLGGAVFVGVNAIWILPELNFIIASGYTNTSHGMSVFSVAYLLSWVSRDTSIINNFSMLSRVVWYDSWGGEPYLPVVYKQVTNNLLHALTLLVPAWAFAALLITRSRRVLFFGAVALFTVFVSKGVHQPAPGLYTWWTAHVPGFWVIRAPWEKFALSTALSYAVLMAVFADWVGTRTYTVPWIAVRIRNIVALRAIVLSVCVALLAALNYPLITGGMLPAKHGVLFGFHQNFPRYTTEAADWLNRQRGDFRIVTMPDSKVSVYDWGYAAPLDATVDLFSKPVLNRQYGQGTAPPRPIDTAYNAFAQAVNAADSLSAENLAKMLNVGYVLQRNDDVYNYFGGHASPAFMASRYSAMPWLKLKRRFGAWQFWKVQHPTPFIYGSDNVVVALGDAGSAASELPPLPPKPVVLLSDVSAGKRALPIDTLTSQLLSSNIPTSTAYPIVSSYAFSARAYPKTKAVVSYDKREQNTAFIVTPRTSPYRFLGGQRTWSAFNSTLLFVATGPLPLRIARIEVHGKQVADIVGVVWKTNWEGFGSKTVESPIIIPPHERAIVQINHLINGTLSVDSGRRTWKVAVQQPGAPRLLSGFSATHVFDQQITADVPTTHTYRILLRIKSSAYTAPTRVVVDGASPSVPSVTRIGTQQEIVQVCCPLLTAGQHRITLKLPRSARAEGGALILRRAGSLRSPYVSYRPVSPTRIHVHVNGKAPFVLVFSDNYDPQWELLPGDPNWFKVLLSNRWSEHYVVNGAANGWLIKNTAPSDYTLVYWPQSLSILGRIIGVSIIFAIASLYCLRAIRKHARNLPSSDASALELA